MNLTNFLEYPDQWDILLNQTEKLTLDEIEKCMAKWQTELANEKGVLVSADVQRGCIQCYWKGNRENM